MYGKKMGGAAKGAAKAPVSKAKAKTMMKEGEIGGKKMTPKQKGLFGAIAGGAYKGKKPTKKG